MKVFFINFWWFIRLKNFIKCTLTVIKSIAKVSYISSTFCLEQKLQFNLETLKFVLQFITPLWISDLFPSASPNSHVFSIYRQTWERFLLERALLDSLIYLIILKGVIFHQPIMRSFSLKTVLCSSFGVRNIFALFKAFWKSVSNG